MGGEFFKTEDHEIFRLTIVRPYNRTTLQAKTSRQKDIKTKRQKDKKKIRRQKDKNGKIKDKNGKRQKREKRQRPNREFHIVMSGHSCNIFLYLHV